jgi:primosomal protein N' (replication factor Y)
MSLYAEVILPLPLRDTFTYSVPEEMSAVIQHGSRVYVQFGKRKHYTGIVVHLHTNAPIGYEVKPISAMLDPAPIIRYPQIRFWEWISNYYLCSIGETYRAAIPSGLKLESESYITLSDDAEPDSDTINEREAEIIIELKTGKKMKLADIKCLSGASLASTVNRLLDKGIITMDERTVSRYRPKKESYVRLLGGNISDNEYLHILFGKVSRSLKQERMLIAFLELARNEQTSEVKREALFEKSGITSTAVLKGLADKGILEVFKKETNRFKSESDRTTVNLPKLSTLQTDAYNAIVESWREKNVVLLRGVTGSGKTEIYTRIINDCLKNGNQALYLVPEISLTTQLTDRLRKVFGSRLVVYHSKFTDSERVDIWRKVLDSVEPMVVIGARSALFLPFHRLGVVVVDEEHESSYKQYDPAPRYNARDAAIMLASMHGAKSLLGSATPSIETYYKALHGKYGLVELTERYSGTSLPDVKIIDMKEERKRKLSNGIISSYLHSALTHELSEKRQAIIFQNRRGFAPYVVCKECGWTPKCVNCDVSMVYHKNVNLLKCHYCGHSVTLPSICPACGLPGIEVYGYGTERISDDIHEAFPEARVARMDLDTTRNKDAYQEIIERFSKGDTDILVGTQMVSKGLDFGNVGIAAVMNADTMLNMPDFRASERAFNMLVQVAGRAGRRDHKGEVIIQTTDTNNLVLKDAATHDYCSYYEREIAERQEMQYPPFTKIINIYLKHKDSQLIDRAAMRYGEALRSVFGQRVLGPTQPPIGRIASYYYRMLMLKIEVNASMTKVKSLLAQIYERLMSERDLRTVVVYYDVDPA